MRAQEYLGDCPSCGDEIYIFRTRSYKRLAKCINEECPDGIIYPIPKSGSIDITGLICPKTKMPLLAIIPNLKLNRNKYRKQEKKTYFWAKGPCFACRDKNKCKVLEDIKPDYDVED